MTIAKMFDCSTPLNFQQAWALKAAGYTVVGRYLGAQTHDWSKSLTPAEVAVLKQAGLMILSIWEGNPTSVGYFTYAQGVQDATEAVEEAKALGQPVGSAIYFTIDYDAQDADMNAIRSYLDAVRKNLQGYKLGVYGGLEVMNNVAADFYWQTVAWSKGQVSSRADILQHAPSTTVGGVQIDDNDVLSGPAWWNQPEPQKAPVQAPAASQNVIANDVPSDAWYADAVKYALSPAGEGILTVDEKGNFYPDQPVTRAMLAEVLYKITHQK